MLMYCPGVCLSRQENQEGQSFAPGIGDWDLPNKKFEYQPVQPMKSRYNIVVVTRETTHAYRNIEARSYNHCCRGKAACKAHAPYILPPVACPAVLYFSTLSHKWYDFRKKKKKVTDLKMCVLIFSTTSVWNMCHSKKNLARYYHKCKNVVI